TKHTFLDSLYYQFIVLMIFYDRAYRPDDFKKKQTDNSKMQYGRQRRSAYESWYGLFCGPSRHGGEIHPRGGGPEQWRAHVPHGGLSVLGSKGGRGAGAHGNPQQRSGDPGEEDSD